MADPKSPHGDIFRSAFVDLMGMGSGETIFKPGFTGTENHEVGAGKSGENTGSYTFHTDRTGNTSPSSGHPHPDYTKGKG